MVRAFGRDGQPVKLARQPRRKTANVDRLLDFAEALGQDLAGFDGDKLAKRGLVRAQLVAEQPDKLATHWRRHLAPFDESRMRSLYGAIHISLPRQLDTADELS